MKNTFKICFFVVVFFIMFLLCFNTQCFASCGDEITESFTAFNGNVYYNKCSLTINNLFSNKGLSHYIVLSTELDGGYCKLRFLCFNDSIDIKYNTDGSFVITFDSGVSGGYIVDYDGNLSCGYADGSPIQEYSSEYSIIYCCDCMMQYQDDFSSDFFGRPLQVGQGILPPIIQVIPLKRVLKEIVEILPIIIVIIVGLIGLRKALKFLLTVLHRS